MFFAGLCEVFPPEPPVAITIPAERRGDVKGAPQFGAAKQTLDSPLVLPIIDSAGKGGPDCDPWADSYGAVGASFSNAAGVRI